jgi:hypothetical protein
MLSGGPWPLPTAAAAAAAAAAATHRSLSVEKRIAD